ncbi:hydrolase [Bordetella hinzii]|uniref:Alpha/beta hydrolase n=1 Tax=Bordetella hinzii TaxID=103855 RepID=A0AAN1VFZ7_9BORD|nr:hydrolase [Bordetella hinzii]AKQ57594.1 Alpha/beta hydrolase family protein [Bordetella hinzii]AKQ62060.1 Alpha/beta hydrolase family protein [Bordetella hinzii]AZW17022.1 alpha/beta hydrolase [Bordetella hinzii]KCB28853.1 alpha/beta hydrolase family protein [Bordetella hinzii L60]MBZ0074974.1 alpha/beta hydrolase [Bordetella hinzii]
MKPSELSNAERMAIELGHAGRNCFPYIDDDRNADRPFTLNTYRPYGYTPQDPVVIVQHGVLRNGDDYRDFWIPAADKHRLLIIAPTFSNEIWPGVESYNNGRVFTAAGNPRHIDGWTYALVGRVLKDLAASEISACKPVYLFGHSAGGQFVHRLMSSQPSEAYAGVIAGNPGWYTLPTLDLRYPEGMGGVGLTEQHLARLLAYPMIILAGDQDTATDDPNLPSQPEALRQGPHRYARAQHYFEAGRKEAERRGLPFGWRLQTVPGIGHDGRAMSAVAAHLWFDGGMPDAATLAALAGNHTA